MSVRQRVVSGHNGLGNSRAGDRVILVNNIGHGCIIVVDVGLDSET